MNSIEIIPYTDMASCRESEDLEVKLERSEKELLICLPDTHWQAPKSRACGEI